MSQTCLPLTHQGHADISRSKKWNFNSIWSISLVAIRECDGTSQQVHRFARFIFLVNHFDSFGRYLFHIKHKRDKLQQGTISFVDSLRSSSILTATVALSSPLFVWLYVSVVNPAYLLFKQENALKIIRDSQIDSNTLLLREDAIRKSFETFSYILSAFVFALAVCLTLSIVLSILIRKKPLSTIPKSDSAYKNPVN